MHACSGLVRKSHRLLPKSARHRRLTLLLNAELKMDCYDHPRLWDLAFSEETTPEADFLTAIIRKYLPENSSAVLEVGCGGGRQVLELSRRGYNVTALDLNPNCVTATQELLCEHDLRATVLQADMTDFVLPQKFCLAHCLVNTFRHLLTEQAAVSHLLAVARSLLPGGLYVLGFHLLPPDALELDCERWTIRLPGERITTTVRVLQFSRRKRIETVRFSLCHTRGDQVRRLAADYPLRIYRADQFRRLLRSVPEFKLIRICDFCYDVQDDFPLNNTLGDAVFVLQKTDA